MWAAVTRRGPFPAMPKRIRPYSRRIALLAAILLLGGAFLWLGTNRWAEGNANAVADASAAQVARSNSGLIASELQKYRLLPLVLSANPDVSALLNASDPHSVAEVNRTLELLASRTSSAAIYLIRHDGLTLAASNWRLPTSFVGRDYSFRPYFRDAMRRGTSELFALGTVSGRPGLYLARRIDLKGQPLGVIVVKVEFDAIEQMWARSTGHSFVMDRHGVILITSSPAWRFRTTQPLHRAVIAETRETLQFGDAPLRAAPLNLTDGTVIVREEKGNAAYRVNRMPIPLEGGTFVRLEPIEPALAAAKANIRFWSLSILMLGGIAAALLLRAYERRNLQRRIRVQLETEVSSRTAELKDANHKLRIESGERQEADRRFRAAREELAQANRLGSIGQITAGVAHEINQPVAAIRAFAENASIFLDREDAGKARENLTTIVDLTARIGTITAELRNFARRGTPRVMAVPLSSVIEGTLLLAGDRIRDMVQVDCLPDDAALEVVGDRVRLEQILLNLLQNAAEALDGAKAPLIILTVSCRGDGDVLVTVTDNGPGIDPALADQIFTPFVTGKENGLGLGLGIARDIARDFGGDLDLRTGNGAGATLQLRLKRA